MITQDYAAGVRLAAWCELLDAPVIPSPGAICSMRR